MDKRLGEILRRIGKLPVQLCLPGSGELLFLPYGGRVLGLFPEGDDRNFFWTNPELDQVDSARALLGSARWQNLGGDRTWLSPEIEYFFPKYPELDGYRPPRNFDGLEYAVAPEPARISLAAEFTVQAFRAGVPVAVRISKTVTAATDPLPPALRAPLRFAGYVLRTSLERIGGDNMPAPLGLWTLCQLPHGGDLYIPTLEPTTATVFFGAVPPEDLRADRLGIRYRLRSPGEHKIGVKAAAVSGRIGYLLRRGGESDLVVRELQVDCRGRYVDGPPTRADDIGYAVEACNVSNPELGDFAELEHHASAIERPGERSVDASTLWAFRGPTAAILEAGRTLLGIGFSP